MAATTPAGRLILRQASQVPIRSTASTTRQSLVRTPSTYRIGTRTRRNAFEATAAVRPRFFGVYTKHSISIMPDAEDPAPKELDTEANPTTATEVTDEEYHEHADRFMDLINEAAEVVQEGREDVEVEYSQGVLSVTFPPNGTYVINKQPPNKQIWLSSPISGPKRYDWVLMGEGMHEKEGGGQGDWIYLRDGSSLQDILRKELGLSLNTERVDDSATSVDPIE